MMSLIVSMLTVTGVIVCVLPIGLIVAAVTMATEDSELRNNNNKKR